ncbi:MAG: hypothetical protein M0R80_17710 [Proteobacteria bacterium]|nr:hypothetical protein [Pseudomonadota bacterium]
MTIVAADGCGVKCAVIDPTDRSDPPDRSDFRPEPGRYGSGFSSRSARSRVSAAITGS